MWGLSLQSGAGVHFKASAKPLRVTPLTEPLAGDMHRISSTKKSSGTASPAQISCARGPSLSKRKNLLKKTEILACVPKDRRIVDACDNQNRQKRKSFIDNSTENKCSGEKEKAEARPSSGST